MTELIKTRLIIRRKREGDKHNIPEEDPRIKDILHLIEEKEKEKEKPKPTPQP